MESFASQVLKADLGQTNLFSVGQAGFIIKSASGELLGIDLYLSDCVETLEGHVGFKRLLPKILLPEELKLDVVIATHPHFDHFDFDAMKGLLDSQSTSCFASVNCENLVKQLKIEHQDITYVKPKDHFEKGDFTMDFVKCDHGEAAPDAVGLVLTVDHKKIYFAGDTCLRLDFAKELQSYGRIDVLVAPINGAYGNLNEKECATLAYFLKPQVTIPCHYGMFASHGGSVKAFIEAMQGVGPFYIMTQGEKYRI